MSLRLSTRRHARLVATALAALLLSGCGATSSRQAATPGDGAAVAGDRVAESGGVTVVDAPPKVLTQFEQAVALMASGDHVVAEMRFNEFTGQYPEYPGAFVNLAIIYSNAGDHDAARSNLDKALALDPEHPAALNLKGLLHRRSGDFAAAEAAYLKAVTVSPEYALAHYNLGVLNELYMQRLDVALQNFQTYQSLVGEDKQVAKWIADLSRRVAATERSSGASE